MEIVDEVLRLSGHEGITGESLIKEANPRHIRLNEILAFRREYEKKRVNKVLKEASDHQGQPKALHELKDTF